MIICKLFSFIKLLYLVIDIIIFVGNINFNNNYIAGSCDGYYITIITTYIILVTITFQTPRMIIIM